MIHDENGILNGHGAGSVEYNLLYRAHGIRVGTIPHDHMDKPGKMIEVDLVIGSEGTVLENLKQLLERLEKLGEIGFSTSIQPEFSLTCSKYAEEHELNRELARAMRALISTTEEEI